MTVGGGQRNLNNLEHAGRLEIATSFELGAAIQAVGDKVDAVHGDLQTQIETALKRLAPDDMPIILSIGRGVTDKQFNVGNGAVSVLKKITLVKTAPGAFPSSVRFRHDALSGYFVLDSAQLTIEFGLMQDAEPYMYVTNNDAGVDCALIVQLSRMQ